MPRPSLLRREQIVSTALKIIDTRGLDQLSMRNLAEMLGVRAPSLYRYVATKDDLLQEVANEILQQVDVTGFADGDWKRGLIDCARSYRAALSEHPNIVPFLAYGPARSEASLHRLDALHGGLLAAGWTRRQATMIAASLLYLVFGAALSSFSSGFPADAAVYQNRYAHLDKAHLLASVAEQLDHDSFELGLQAFVTGLETLKPAVDQ